MKRALLTASCLLLAGGFPVQNLYAQSRLDPVQWTLTSDIAATPPGTIVPLKLTAAIQPGWHIYAPTIPKTKGGPIATSIKIAANPAVESYTIYQPRPLRKRDTTIDLDTEMFENQADFWIPAKLAADLRPGLAELLAEVRYQVCDDRQCLLPRTKTAAYSVNIDPAALVPAAFVVPAEYTDIRKPAPVQNSGGDAGLGAYALAAFGFGLAAIFTPCVFPMIPVTVSFFLSQRGGLLQAMVFSLGIVGLFCGLGLGLTALLGPFGVVELTASPWVNGFIALVFALFSLSLLGAFELTLPSGLLTKMDRASRRGGYLGTLLMGLTFSLTSFACVGPFVGPLLVSSVQGAGMAQPVIGMAGFAMGLASPFFFLAAFPSYLKKLPKSGGWLARVKVVAGFLLLAIMFKYLSNVDQVLQWGLLTRERFLAAWFVLFSLAGLYLLGLLRLEGIEPGEPLGIGRMLAGAAFLMFSFTLLPGMLGAPLGELDAYVPAPSANAALGGQRNAGPEWMKDQFEEALALGRQHNKLVLVNFTGYTCTNCHWMKANMFPRPGIAAALEEFIRVDLYIDGGDATSEANQALEEAMFQTVTMPFYAILDAERKVIATFSGSTRDEGAYLRFLQSRPL
jgi:thiol:disulfide interchange protein DsbD